MRNKFTSLLNPLIFIFLVSSHALASETNIDENIAACEDAGKSSVSCNSSSGTSVLYIPIIDIPIAPANRIPGITAAKNNNPTDCSATKP